MTNKTILDAVHETEKGLHKAGAMDGISGDSLHVSRRGFCSGEIQSKDFRR